MLDVTEPNLQPVGPLPAFVVRGEDGIGDARSRRGDGPFARTLPASRVDLDDRGVERRLRSRLPTVHWQQRPDRGSSSANGCARSGGRLRGRVGPQPALEIGAVHEVTGIRAVRPRQSANASDRSGKCDATTRRGGASPPQPANLPDVLRQRLGRSSTQHRRGQSLDSSNGSLVEQPDPMLASTLGELFAEADVVIAVHASPAGRRPLLRGGRTCRLEVGSRFSKLDDVSQQRGSDRRAASEEPRRGPRRCAGRGSRARRC